VPGLQVWAVDRRSQALEDTKMFDDARAGRVSVKQAFDFYLGWLADPSITSHYQPPDVSKLGFAKRWGLSVTLDGIRRIVLRARAQGKRVILGGHSLGGSLTTIYATWDFGGRPGYQDVDALVLIDGGTLGTFATPTLKQTRDELAKLQAGSPFADVIGFGLPWAAGVFAQAGAVAALREPTAPSIGQAFAPLPAGYKPPVPATNRGLFGYAFDKETSASGPEPPGQRRPPRHHRRPARLGRRRRGHAAEQAGRPLLRQAERDGVVLPERLRIEVDAAQDLRRNAQTRLLGLRPWHLAQVDRPALRLPDRPHERRRPARRAALRRALGVAAVARALRRRLEDRFAPRPAERRSVRRAAFLQTVVPWLRKVLAR
jgi:pimeloyl-ACP methyl ester carboxylesterase